MKKQGLIAGISLVIMAIAAGFSYGFVYSGIVVDDPVNTLANLVEKRSLFTAGLAGWVVIFITDLVVTFSLFRFFSETDRKVSMGTALVRLIYTLLLGAGIIQLFMILPLAGESALTDPFDLSAEVSSHLFQFSRLWSIGLILFGVHIGGLGYLSVKSGIVPKIFGYLLYISGVSYLFVHGARQLQLFDPEFVTGAESILSLPMALGEMLLAFWLIYHGLRKKS